MFGFKVLIVLMTCLSWTYCKLDKYCSICEDHTMCKYHGIGKKCENAGGSGVTKAHQKEILDTHNWLRRIVASGYEERGVGGPQPKAANLMKFTWDAELAKVAQRWADQCSFQHDICRDDPRWKVGQNIYWKWKYPKHQVNWTEAILSWYNEVSLYDPQNVNSYRFESATGHYTQILWDDTYAIGCGRRDYGPNKLYVCNYGPAGNWLGEPMYEVGEPCSKCPEETFCDEFLCAYKNAKFRIEIPSEAERPNINSLRIMQEADTVREESANGTENLQVLKPSSKNAKDDYGCESEQKTLCDIEVQTQGGELEKEVEPIQRQLNDVSSDQEEEKTTTNSIDENEILLDADTEKGIEDIKLRIEALVKKVFKKFQTKN